MCIRDRLDSLVVDPGVGICAIYQDVSLNKPLNLRPQPAGFLFVEQLAVPAGEVVGGHSVQCGIHKWLSPVEIRMRIAIYSSDLVL